MKLVFDGYVKNQGKTKDGKDFCVYKLSFKRPYYDNEIKRGCVGNKPYIYNWFDRYLPCDLRVGALYDVDIDEVGDGNYKSVRLIGVQPVDKAKI